MKNSLNELKETLEAIRLEKYPEIPRDLIDEIVDVQNGLQDDIGKRQKATKAAIDKYTALLKPKGGE